ncbi:MAG: hypothetical protein QW620_07395, partial [Thermoplasmata archaeon]
FKCELLADVLEREIEKPTVCIRHDIDVDPKRAIAMAEIEQKHGLVSTYYVMVNSPLYNVEEHCDVLKKLLGMGNDIGLHFSRKEIQSIEKIGVEVASDCRILEDLLGTKVRTISFHRPPQQVLRSSEHIAGRVNAYSAKLMEWYISDSRCRFRAGEPIRVIKEHKGKILQFLTHPIWWGEKHASGVERITEWFNQKTVGFSKQQKEEFAKKVYEEIDVFPNL